MDSLKQFFKGQGLGNRNLTPDKSPDKGKNYYLNSNFKQVEKSPINTKSKLTSNQNNNNYLSNSNQQDKGIGFDEDLINVLNDIEENDNKGKKDSFKKANWQQNLNNNFTDNINSSFEKGLKYSDNNINDKQGRNNMEDFGNYNEVFTVSNNNQAVVLIELNQGWDKDFNEISKLAEQRGRDKPTYKKSEQLKTEMSRIVAKNPNISRNDISMMNENNPNIKYKNNVLLFDDPSLHIRQAVNEAYVVENLHYGIEDNLNKSIDYKQNNPSVLRNLNKKKAKTEVREKSIDGGNSNVIKKIIENNDNSWTFSITVPVKEGNN
jgi:hypothetical protein